VNQKVIVLTNNVNVCILKMRLKMEYKELIVRRIRMIVSCLVDNYLLVVLFGLLVAGSFTASIAIYYLLKIITKG